MLTTGNTWWHENINEDRILGWVALYWDGSGSLNNAQIFSSIPLPWDFVVHQPDPELLPTTGLQGYLLFWRRWGSMYTYWFDGYDEYWLWGKTDPVLGLLLPDNKWKQMAARIRGDIYLHRGAFKRGHTVWMNEVPD